LHQKYKTIDFEICGIDLDLEAISAKVDDEVNLSCNSAESLSDSAECENQSYDLILHYELIEHLIDPFVFMGTVKRLLKPNGLCIFTTPNSHGAENLAVNYNSRRLLAHGIFPPMHLNAFNTQNISVFAYRLGFDIVEVITPGKLDVDMITVNKEYLTNDSFKKVANLDDEDIKALIQEYTVACLASSHMQCILRNPI
jgi:SAM-dependent methyltransferase